MLIVLRSEPLAASRVGDVRALLRLYPTTFKIVECCRAVFVWVLVFLVLPEMSCAFLNYALVAHLVLQR